MVHARHAFMDLTDNRYCKNVRYFSVDRCTCTLKFNLSHGHFSNSFSRWTNECKRERSKQTLSARTVQCSFSSALRRNFYYWMKSDICRHTAICVPYFIKTYISSWHVTYSNSICSICWRRRRRRHRWQASFTWQVNIIDFTLLQRWINFSNGTQRVYGYAPFLWNATRWM